MVARCLAIVVVLAASACGAAPAQDAHEAAVPRPAHGTHLQIFRALSTEQRTALVERFRARNGPWTITLGAGTTPDDVDPIRGAVRRATRDGAPSGGAASDGDVDEPRAVCEASAFLARNADLLGFAADDVPALDLVVSRAKTATYGTLVVQARGQSPMRGYEGFDAVATAIDVLVYLGDDGAARYFVNLSRVHPRLLLDTTPLLGPDDARLLKNVLGRTVFVVVDDPSRPQARARELRRIPLGAVEASDIHGVHLTIDVSPGPRFAYVSYALAYAVDVVRGGQPFRFVVDADTGTLLEDPVVPVVNAPPGDED